VLYHQKLDRATINRIRHMQAVAADKLQRDGYRVAFIPFHCVPPDDDREEIRIIRNLMKENAETLPRPEDTIKALKIIGKASLVVGLRLHSLIFASMQGPPPVSVNYDAKIRDYMEHIYAPGYLVESTQGLDRLYWKAKQALEDTGYGGALAKRVKAIRGLINSEANRLVSMLTKGRGYGKRL